MATPSDMASAALDDIDRLRNALKRKHSVQVSSKDERDLVKATALTWFNTHRKNLDAGMGEAKAVDNVFRQMLCQRQSEFPIALTHKKPYFEGVVAS